MTQKILGPGGSRRRKRLWLVPLLVLVAATVFWVAGAQAVHDEGVFELEGNATLGVDANNPANPQSQPAGGHDWSQVYADSLTTPHGTTAGAEALSFVTDTTLSGGLAGAGDSILTGGSTKDINDLNQWLWKETASTSVQDKDDIEHAYAAQYKVDKDPGNCGSLVNQDPCVLLYFGADRFSNSGDSVMGFWFFKKNISAVGPDASGNGTFSGGPPPHTARTATERGDILVVSDFRAGGKAPSIQVYEWVDSGGSASTHLDQIGGSDNPASCTQAPPEGGKDKNPVPPVSANDNFCATANQNVVTSPWPFDAKPNSGGTSGTGGSSTKYGVAEFMEGGINMTALGLGNTCFSTFMAESRAAHSVTSTLSDFLLGTFGACTSGITTTPQNDTGGAIPSTIGANARVAVRDHADITVTGFSGTFGGTVTFSLCGPLAAGSTTNCSTGGAQIGSAVAVTGNAGTASLNSPTVTLTSAGYYCWRAVYSGDSGKSIPASTDPVKSVADGGGTSECFTIGPEQPTLSTTGGSDVILGNAITDTATISGTAKKPGTGGQGGAETIAPGSIGALATTQVGAGGTITWSLKGPGNCNDAGLTLTGNGATVSGNGTYGPVSATPTQIGTYTWVASYSGSSPNTLGAGPSSCPPGANDGDEEVTVTGTASLSTAQDWLPNDTATLTGDTNLNGTLTFTLYPTSDCTGTAVTGQTYTRTVTNAASGTTFSTSNTTFKVNTANAGDYSWKVHYDDTKLQDPSDTCETSTVSVTDS